MTHAAILTTAARELATGLQIGACEIIKQAPAVAPDQQGASVPIVGERVAVQVAISSSSQAFAKLARKFLQLGPSEPMTAEDCADALRELANMLAGRVKAGLLHEDHSVRLGLPLLIDGAIRHNTGIVCEVHATLGGVPLSFSMFEQRK